MSAAPPPAAAPPVASHATVAAILGLIFLALGWPVAQWLGTRTGNPYGVVWTDGPDAGRPIAYADLPLGTMWRDAGAFATSVVLLTEAVLYAAVLLRPRTARPLLTLVLVVASVGVGANALSVALQARAGFYQPLYALVGLVLCVLSITSARQARRAMVE